MELALFWGVCKKLEWIMEVFGNLPLFYSFILPANEEKIECCLKKCLFENQ